jgi:hypothetical protein
MVATASTRQASPCCFVCYVSDSSLTTRDDPTASREVTAKGKNVVCFQAPAPGFGHDRSDRVHQLGQGGSGDPVGLLEQRDEEVPDDHAVQNPLAVMDASLP